MRVGPGGAGVSEAWRRISLDPLFRVRLPPGWEAEIDAEEGGVLFAREDGEGVLHLLGFPRAGGAAADPAEELYGFLEEEGIELQEDEIEDLELEGEGEASLCEYVSEDEEEGETTYWLTGVAVGPGGLVFISYSAAGEEGGVEAEEVREILRTLRIDGSS